MNFISHTFMHTTKEAKTLSNVTINKTMLAFSAKTLSTHYTIHLQGGVLTTMST